MAIHSRSRAGRRAVAAAWRTNTAPVTIAAQDRIAAQDSRLRVVSGAKIWLTVPPV